MSRVFQASRLFPRIASVALQHFGRAEKPFRCIPVSGAIQSVRFGSDIPRENVPISMYPVPDLSTLDQDLQDRFRDVEEKTGFLPNVFKALMHRPAELRAFLGYYDVLMDRNYGRLTPAEKELIVVATSARNNCQYCVVAHSAIHRIFSKSPYVADQVAINWENANLSSREKAILEFALDIMDCEVVTEEHYEALAKEGLDREDAWDIGAIVALFALSNRMAFTTGMKPNEEFYLLGRVSRHKSK